MYDPTVGRWLSLDPIGFEGNDTNLYRYVGNDVLCCLDPNGLAVFLFDIYNKGGESAISAFSENLSETRKNMDELYDIVDDINDSMWEKLVREEKVAVGKKLMDESISKNDFLEYINHEKNSIIDASSSLDYKSSMILLREQFATKAKYEWDITVFSIHGTKWHSRSAVIFPVRHKKTKQPYIDNAQEGWGIVDYTVIRPILDQIFQESIGKVRLIACRLPGLPEGLDVVEYEFKPATYDVDYIEENKNCIKSIKLIPAQIIVKNLIKIPESMIIK